MKKSLIFILALTLGVGTMQAENGTCGENLTWNLKGKVLTIQGKGAMPDFAQGTTPWNEAQETIMTVVVKDGVTN